MKITQLQLNNFRGFKELEINLPASDLAVIIGINGAGKSSLLDCAAMFLSRLVTGLCGKNERENEFPITENDINTEAAATVNRITLETASVIGPSAGIQWELARDRMAGKIRGKAQSSLPGDYIRDIHARLREKPTANLPVLMYYQNQKISPSKRLKSKPKKYEFSQFYAYEGAFRQAGQDFSDFITWFRLEEDWENEKKIEKGLDFVSQKLEVVRRAIGFFLGRMPMADLSHFHVVRAERDQIFGFDTRFDSSLVIEKKGKRLKMEQLSDGERMLLLVVSDLARRLAVANPDLADPLEGKGVVLIDEIDLHLHPRWQREVVPALRGTFPGCQFIVTTHSPQVLSNVEKENVLMLEDYGIVEHNPFTYGKDSNSILYQLMNVEERPAEIKKQLDKLYRLIDEDKIDDAREEIKQLAEILGDDDPEILRANMHMDFHGT